LNIQKTFGIVNRDLDLLAPFIRTRAVSAIHEAQLAGYPVAVFEAFRSPFRQDALYAQGRTEPGKIVSDAKSWQSLHQYGLALDVAFLIKGKWSWDADFWKIRQFFTAVGFKPLETEHAHFQIDGGLSWQRMKEINDQFGLMTLWAVVKETL
jgi:peptidoglycan L-alanyl-D-glutamate endopeptidase CwlK